MPVVAGRFVSISFKYIGKNKKSRKKLYIERLRRDEQLLQIIAPKFSTSYILNHWKKIDHHRGEDAHGTSANKNSNKNYWLN